MKATYQCGTTGNKHSAIFQSLPTYSPLRIRYIFAHTVKTSNAQISKMVFTMVIYTDGGCRNNGRPGAIGAAAAVVEQRFGKKVSRTESLSTDQWPATNQRAEILGIIIALELALEKHRTLHTNPRLDLTIYTDSKYARDCMTNWIYKWTRNGWINAAGQDVVNQDLLKKASSLDDEVVDIGNVRYEWIPREENQLADELCNDDMDEQERAGTGAQYWTDSDSDW